MDTLEVAETAFTERVTGDLGASLPPPVVRLPRTAPRNVGSIFGTRA